MTQTAAGLPGLVGPATPRRPVSPAVAASLALGLAAAGLALRLFHADRVPWLATLLLLFSSLLIQAFPFVLLGALASAAIEVFVPGSALARFGRLPRRLQLPVAGVSGLAFPVCECGSVPVARRPRAASPRVPRSRSCWRRRSRWAGPWGSAPRASC